MSLTRRVLIATCPAVLAAASLRSQSPGGSSTSRTPAYPPSTRAPIPPTSGLGASFPTQDPAVVREVVGVSHGNFARLKELVDRQPTLAKAAWDWGFGDWESALGAAAHVGNREIAEYLLAHGAQPTIFAAAMLGQLDVVRSFVAAAPGVQRTLGPHGISLLRHAQAGEAAAKPVVDYLTALGDADPKPETQPLDPGEAARLAGSYRYGAAPDEVLEVSFKDERLSIGRVGGSPRWLTHTGGLVFFPAGAPKVQIRFTVSETATQLEVLDPGVLLSATRS